MECKSANWNAMNNGTSACVSTVDMMASYSNCTAMIDRMSKEVLPLPVTGLILCGGRSRRMGRPKAFLPYAGRTIIEHQLNIFREIFTEVFLVANEPDTYSHLSVDVVKDILPYRGPLGGILSGLLVA